MAKWEIIEDKKLKKQVGGAAKAATRNITANKTASNTQPVTSNQSVITPIVTKTDKPVYVSKADYTNKRYGAPSITPQFGQSVQVANFEGDAQPFYDDVATNEYKAYVKDYQQKVVDDKVSEFLKANPLPKTDKSKADYIENLSPYDRQLIQSSSSSNQFLPAFRQYEKRIGENAKKYSFTEAYSDPDKLSEVTHAGLNRFRVFPDATNSIEDFVNPGLWFGQMEQGLGDIPKNIRDKNYLAATMAVVNPILMGRAIGSGSINPLGKSFWTNEVSNAQFINNLVNPLAGIVDANTVKGLGNKAVDKYIGNSFTPELGNIGAEAFGLGKPNIGSSVDNVVFKLESNYGGLNNASKALNEHISGIKQGFSDKRPFFEKFPITDSQKAKVYAAQDKALAEGKQFIQDWYYGKGLDLHPDIVKKMQEINPSFTPSLEDNTSLLRSKGVFQNPFNQTNDILASTRRGILNKENISNYAKKYMLDNRNMIYGVNIPSTNESITLRNRGLYHHSPEAIKNTVVHEAGHTAQKLGKVYATPTGDTFVISPFGNIQTYDPSFTKYYYANPNTKEGKLFEEAMVKTIPHVKDAQGFIIKEGYRWAASPGELHSELLTAREKLTDSYVKHGYDRKEIINQIRGNVSDEQIDWMIKNNNLNRFFKKTTSPELKRKVIRMLYTGIPGAIGLGAASELQQKQTGGIIEDPRGQWAHPGSITKIPSNQITMQDVNYPVLGVSDRGHTQMMYPGEDYSFRGNSVTEYPMMQGGGRYISESVQPQPSKNYTGTFLPINRDPYGNARKKLFDNENKSPSTESVIGINDDSGYYNIPTVVNGVRLSDEDAVNNFYDNGMYHTGYFNTQEEADRSADYRERANIGLLSTGLYKYGGEVNFTYAGENHRVYKKESPTGNGKGIEGHIMVNHPTENKGKWDTIDLTKITNGKVKTVAQGVASTKKWHKENPEYANGGQISSWEIIEDLPKAQNGITTNFIRKDISDTETKKVQTELVKAGYDIGLTGSSKDGIDGKWGPKTEKAYQDFIAKQKASILNKEISSIVKPETIISFSNEDNNQELLNNKYAEMMKSLEAQIKQLEDEKLRVSKVRTNVIPTAKKIADSDNFSQNFEWWETEEGKNYTAFLNAKNPQELEIARKNLSSRVKNLLPNSGKYTVSKWDKSTNDWNPQNKPSRELYCTPYGCFAYQKAGASDVPIVSGNIGFQSMASNKNLPFEKVSNPEPGDIGLLIGYSPKDYSNPSLGYTDRAHHTVIYNNKDAKGVVNAYNADNGERLNYELDQFPLEPKNPKSSNKRFEYYRYVGQTNKMQDAINKSKEELANIENQIKAIKNQPIQLNRMELKPLDIPFTNEMMIKPAFQNGGQTKSNWEIIEDVPKMQHGGGYIKNYNKKFPPIYLSDPNDPRIGLYSVKGNQYLYREPNLKKQEKIIPMNVMGLETLIPSQTMQKVPVPNPITSIPKDYYTIKTGSSYRNPETGAFEQKTFKIDKVTGKRITEPTFQNGGQTKSNWEILEDTNEDYEYKNGGKTPAWQRKEGKSPTGGLNAKGRASLKKEGHDIKPPQPEGGSRKKSFCARMTGLKKKLTGSKKANDPNSRVNLSLKKWKC
jgi:hypothetical protein